MGILGWILLAAALALALYVVQAVHMSIVLKWEDEQTVGLAYYGRPAAERRAFKESLRRQARWLRPFLWLMNRTSKLDFRRAAFRYEGVAGPRGSCSPATFECAARYQPAAADVFVVTQMKCGTTWMQHVVYEVLRRGSGDLVDTGTALYAVCPWIEGRKSVSVEEAPLVGRERPSRVIKTHLPATLLPDAPAARYIYVARHPVSCFASCVDFVGTNVGGMMPAMDALERWFQSSELMWWGTWPDHVTGWWDRSVRNTNVLFLYFEDMKRDLPAVVRRVAAFLDMAPLTDAELAEVVRKCGFRYMQEHQEAFEMHPPHLLQTNAELFVAGTADRHQDVPADLRGRLNAWCTAAMETSDFPLAERYPDVVEAPGTSPVP